MIKTGTTLKGRYEIRERLAKGGFATVYTAWDSTFERLVAVKVVDLNEDEDGNPQSGGELLREARVVANNHHPNVLDVYDFGDYEDQTYLVMPLADGGTLFQLLRQSGPFSFEQADRYLQQMAAGLDHAHRLKVVHRDIKPQNFLLFGPDKQHLVISDFGVAKAVSQSSIASLHVTGTPRYMAPEQFMGRASYSSDIYSLGVVLYHMLAGAPPFKGDQTELMYAHMNLPPAPLSSKRPGTPPALDQLIERTLAKDPTQRPKSAGELAYAYQQAILPLRYSQSDDKTINETLLPPTGQDSTRPFTPAPYPVESSSANPTPTTPSSNTGTGFNFTPPPSSVSQTPSSSRLPFAPDPSDMMQPTISLPNPTPPSNKVEVAKIPPVNPPPVPPAGEGTGGNKRMPLIIGGIIAAVLLVVVVGVVLALSSSSKPGTPTPTVAASVATPTVATPATVATTAAPTTAPVFTATFTAQVSPTTAATVTLTPVPTTPARPTAVAPLGTTGDPALTANIEIWVDEADKPDEWKVLNESLAGFKQLFPKVEIAIKTLDRAKEGSISNKVSAAQAGYGPDLIIAPADSAGDWASQGLIQPLHPLLGDEFLQNYDQLALSSTLLNNVGYGLPYTYGNILMLYYNKSLITTPPATFDDLLKQAQNLKVNGVTGLSFDRGDYSTLLPFLDAYAGWPVDNAGKITLDTTPMTKALQYFKNLAGQAPLDYNEANKLFTDGKLAFYINGSWELGNYINNNVNVGIAPLPSLEGRTPHAMILARHYFLGKQATGDRQKAALLFLQYQARIEQQRKQLNNLGLIPPTKAALTELEQKNPLWAEVVRQLKTSRTQPVYKDMPKVWGAIANGMREVLAGTVSPEDAPKLIQKAATG